MERAIRDSGFYADQVRYVGLPVRDQNVNSSLLMRTIVTPLCSGVRFPKKIFQGFPCTVAGRSIRPLDTV